MGMDGPVKLPKVDNVVSRLLGEIEDYIYAAISTYEPDLILLLDATHKESHIRKPGEISKSEFDKKMKIARTVFQGLPNCRVIDAKETFDS